MSLHRDLLKACNARMIVGDKHAGTLTMLVSARTILMQTSLVFEMYFMHIGTGLVEHAMSVGMWVWHLMFFNL